MSEKKTRAKRTGKVEFYRDDDGKHRWRIRAASNNKILADSAEAYSREIDAQRAFKTVVEEARDWPRYVL